jgi:hypothetical protein
MTPKRRIPPGLFHTHGLFGKMGSHSSMLCQNHTQLIKGIYGTNYSL